MTRRRFRKTIIEVEVIQNTLGRITPVAIVWAGRRYEVERVIEKVRSPAYKVGDSMYTRYTCIINHRPKQLFLEDGGTWFVEERVRR